MRLAHFTAFGSIMTFALLAATALVSTATAKSDPASAKETQEAPQAESPQITPIEIISGTS